MNSTDAGSTATRLSFDLDDDQRQLRELAAGLLDREATAERLEAHDKSGATYDRTAWKALAQAGLLGVCLPEDLGGAGLGPVELAIVLREIGVHVAPVPAYAALALGALPVARHGTPAQRARLTAVAEGETLLTGAVREPGAADPADVATIARTDGDAFVLTGVKAFVPYAAEAQAVLVPARVDGGEVGVFLVEPSAMELTAQPSATTEPLYRLGLDGVRVGADALLGGTADGQAWRTLRRLAVAGAVAVVSGVMDGALTLTAGYVKGREQFGRALAEFQAVTMQMGDVYITKRAVDVAMWAGAWRLAQESADVDELLAVAAVNACDPVPRALYTCQHLHGGIGLDKTYPLHRFFGWGKHYAHLLGGAEAWLDALGGLIASGDESGS